MSDDPFKPFDSSSGSEWSHFKPVDIYGAGNSKQSNWAYSSSTSDSSKKEQSFYSSTSTSRPQASEQSSWAYSIGGGGNSNSNNNSGNNTSWAFQSSENKKENQSGIYSRVSDSLGMGAETHLNQLKEQQRASSLKGWEDADRSWHFEDVNGQMERDNRISNIESSLYSARYSGFHSCASWAYASGSSSEASWAFSTKYGSTENKSGESWAYTIEPPRGTANNNSQDGSWAYSIGPASPSSGARDSWAYSTEPASSSKRSEDSWAWSPVGDSIPNKLKRW